MFTSNENRTRNQTKQLGERINLHLLSTIVRLLVFSFNFNSRFFFCLYSYFIYYFFLFFVLFGFRSTLLLEIPFSFLLFTFLLESNFAVFDFNFSNLSFLFFLSSFFSQSTQTKIDSVRIFVQKKKKEILSNDVEWFDCLSNRVCNGLDKKFCLIFATVSNAIGGHNFFYST